MLLMPPFLTMGLFAPRLQTQTLRLLYFQTLGCGSSELLHVAADTPSHHAVNMKDRLAPLANSLSTIVKGGKRPGRRPTPL